MIDVKNFYDPRLFQNFDEEIQRFRNAKFKVYIPTKRMTKKEKALRNKARIYCCLWCDDFFCEGDKDCEEIKKWMEERENEKHNNNRRSNH